MRLSSHIKEVDRVLGGGIVAGEVILLGGDPGIGKSTLSLQIAGNISTTLYISGEESIEQLKLRADRLRVTGDILLLNSINVKDIEKHIKETKPQLVIVDSVQTIYYPEIPSAPGSATQVRESASYLIRAAKSLNIPVILIGHITKEGSIAGPKILEHLVDGVFYFEGDRKQDYRILRSVKNRYGNTDEIGIFEMTSLGLAEVTNFSTAFINKEVESLPGTVITSAIEGSRSFLIEIQALVSPTSFSMPKRVFTGVDANRVAIISAVLEKKLGLSLSQSDIFINVVGGMKITEPAIDLAIALALISAVREIPYQAAAIGEIGLSGELRPIPQLDKRVKELQKMGIEKIFIPGEKEKQGVFALKTISELAAALG